MAWILGVSCLLAAQEEVRLSTLVESLGSDEVDRRQEAEVRLKARPADELPALKVLLEQQRDSEIRARLQEAIRQILRREGDARYAEGMMEDALLRYSEAEGADDLMTYMRERVKKVRKEIGSWFEHPWSKVAIVHVIYDYEALARKVKTDYGPWGMAALLEELGATPPWRFDRAYHILCEMGDEAVPFLTAALAEPTSLIYVSAFHLLQSMACTFKPDRDFAVLIEAFRRVSENDRMGSTDRADAARMVRTLTVSAEFVRRKASAGTPPAGRGPAPTSAPSRP